jgi:hypothetical protein
MERRDPLSGETEPFLARWSRRKHESRDGAVTPGPAAPEVPPAPGPPAGAVSRALTDADMPPVEKLGYDDDWSGFLSPGVSDRLRGEALRRLFSSPQLNVGDGLDSYSGDYTRFEALGDTVTADMKHQMERLLDRLAAAGDAGGESLAAESTEPPPAALAAGPAAPPDSGEVRDAEESTPAVEPHHRAGGDD